MSLFRVSFHYLDIKNFWETALMETLVHNNNENWVQSCKKIHAPKLESSKKLDIFLLKISVTVVKFGSLKIEKFRSNQKTIKGFGYIFFSFPLWKNSIDCMYQMKIYKIYVIIWRRLWNCINGRMYLLMSLICQGKQIR